MTDIRLRLLVARRSAGELDRELATTRASLLCRRAIDSDRYGGFNKEEELKHSELPPDREPR